VRFLFLFLLIGCNAPHKQLTPSDTKLKLVDRNWEQLYARELQNALKNEDDAAFYFEQVADFVRKNPHKGLQEDVGRVLGL